MKSDYVTITIEEYFKALEVKNEKQDTVAKNLLKYLRRNQERKIAA